MQERQEEPLDCVAGVTPVEGEREGRRPEWEEYQTAAKLQEMFSQTEGEVLSPMSF